jgi:hypothetical protein
VPCPAGIVTTILLPPSWDRKHLDSPDQRCSRGVS